MTTPHMDFDAQAGGANDTSAKPSCTFKLGGRDWSCRSPEQVPLAVFKKMLGSTDSDVEDEVEVEGDTKATLTPAQAKKKAQKTRESFSRIDDFFAATLVPSEVDDFLAMLNDPKITSVTTENLQPIMQYVTEHVLNRPTKRPASSRSRSQSTKPKSAAA